jgi:GNAT superfamily N-acetyltransferase
VPTIRSCRPAELDSLYAISLATGHQGGNASHLYEDGRLIGHIYAAPYAVLEPGLALVVEDEEGVAGFAVGVSDTKRWHERLEAEWWPRLRQDYADPSATSPSEWSADQRRAFAIHRPELPPAPVVSVFPAHLHLNLLPRIQSRGVGSRLLSHWAARASARGVQAVHVGVNRANPRAARFWAGQGFEPLPPEGGRTLWMGRHEGPPSRGA